VQNAQGLSLGFSTYSNIILIFKEFFNIQKGGDEFLEKGK